MLEETARNITVAKFLNQDEKSLEQEADIRRSIFLAKI